MVGRRVSCPVSQPLGSLVVSWFSGRLLVSRLLDQLLGPLVVRDEDDDEDPNGEDYDTSFFDTTTNLWPDAFLAGRGGDLFL